MQSELSSHIGLKGRCFCRICKVDGQVADPLTSQTRLHEDLEASNASDGSLALSEDSDYSSTGRANSGKSETLQNQFTRIKQFMMVCKIL
jgi:hypothetical protein